MNKQDIIIKMRAENEALKEQLEQQQKKGQVMFITAVYDKRAEQFQNIMTTPSKAYAVRGFMDAVKNEESHLNKYAEDFKLVLLGLFNTKTGKVLQNEALETLVEASSIVAK